MRKVLNVGGGSKEFALPPEYEGWQQVLLDIDPRGEPDVVCDARNLMSLPAAKYDSIYCSHNLEHYYQHDVAKVLDGFNHVLLPDGFVYVRVPDIAALMKAVVEKSMDINDVLYEAPAGAVTIHDIVYGFGAEIQKTGNDYFAHKTGFTQKSLISAMQAAGFAWIYTDFGYFEIRGIACKNHVSDYAAALFGFSASN